VLSPETQGKKVFLPGTGERGIKENHGRSEFKYDIFDIL
jgi:hypothetical protein